MTFVVIAALISVCHSRWIHAEVVSGFSEEVLAISDNPSGVVASELQNAIESYSAGNDQACLERLQLSAERHPELPPAQVMLATLHCRFNKPQRARTLLQEVESEFADDPGYVLTLARVYLAESRSVEGIALADRALQLAEASQWSSERRQRFTAMVNHQKLKVFESQKKWAEVVTLLSGSLQNKLRSVSPTNDAMRIRYARALFFTGQVDEARSQLEQTGVADSRLALAQWHNEAGQYGEAEMLLRDVVSRSSNPMLRIALANYLLDRNKIDHAHDTISPLNVAQINHQPRQQDPNQELLSKVGIEFEPASGAQQALQDEKVRNEVAIVQVRIALLRGNWNRAIETLEPVYQVDSSRLYVANLFARALISSDNVRRRQQGIDIAFSKAAQHPSDVECAVTLAWAQLHLDQSATAEASLMRIATRQEVSPDTAYFAARALAESGNPELARSLVRRALESDGPFDMRRHANNWANVSLPGRPAIQETEQVFADQERISVAQRMDVAPTNMSAPVRVTDQADEAEPAPEQSEERGFVIDPDALFLNEASE